MSVALGTVPDWIAAIATAGAFGYTGWLLHVTVQDRQKADRRDREAQASRVTAWVDAQIDTVDRVLKRPVIRIRNGSEEPVYDVNIIVGGTERRRLRVLPPVQEPAEVRLPDAVYVSEDMPSVSVEFTDARGNRWRRESEGALIPAAEVAAADVAR